MRYARAEDTADDDDIVPVPVAATEARDTEANEPNQQVAREHKAKHAVHDGACLLCVPRV